MYGSSATLIDNIFTNDLANNISSGNIVTDTTDHFSQVCIVNVNKQNLPHTKKTKFRDYSSFDANKFMNDLSAINWEEVSGGRNIKYTEILGTGHYLRGGVRRKNHGVGQAYFF